MEKEVIKISNASALSKQQQLFNQLNQKLVTLNEKLEDKSIQYRAKYMLYQEKIIPLIEEESTLEIKFIKSLHNHFDNFSQKDQNVVADYISMKVSDYSDRLDNDDELKNIFDEYSTYTYDETKDMASDYMKQELEDQFGEGFLEDIGLDDFDFADESHENMSRFANAMKDHLKNNEFHNPAEEKKTKKKSKTQLKKEELEKQKEELKNKSLKSIYYALSKMLHPDLEKDVTLKGEKEEAMKMVTSAYESKDLTALLKLEMYWISKHAEHLDKMADEQLLVYNELLKDQIKEIEIKISAVDYNPLYRPISHLLHIIEASFKKRIDGMKNQQTLMNEKLASILGMNLTVNTDKKTIIKYIKEYIRKEEENEMMDFFSQIRF